MAKNITGIVRSNKMQNTVVVEVARRVPHPLYKKLLKRSSTFKADTNGKTIVLGDTVIITETKPISKDKHFIVTEVITRKEGAK